MFIRIGLEGLLVCADVFVWRLGSICDVRLASSSPKEIDMTTKLNALPW